MQLLCGIHVLSMIVLFFLGIIYIREFQIIIANIETWGFNEQAYAAPSYNFAIRALFFCLLTIFVGLRTWSKMRTTGSLLLMVGGVFFTFSIVMLLVPRYTSIVEVFPYWCIYIFSALILTFVASLKFDSSPVLKREYEDDILDDIEEEEHV